MSDEECESELPKLGAETLRPASRTFPLKTGLGADSWHPRAFSLMSDHALDELGALLEAIEKFGVLPVALLLLVFLPKKDGGHRPIGLIVGLLRLWARARKLEATRWEEENQRDFFWAGKGKSATDSVHHQTVRAEAALADKRENASVLLDMVKCYEKIRHIVLRPGLKSTILT